MYAKALIRNRPTPAPSSQHRWVILICSVGLAVVLGFVFTLFMKHFAGCMVWTTVVLVVVGLAALDIFFYYKVRSRCTHVVTKSNQPASDFSYCGRARLLPNPLLVLPTPPPLARRAAC